MNTHSAIKARRAVKHYDPNHRLDQSTIDELLDLAMQSPTAFNIQNWRFVVAVDPEVRKRIREVAWDQAQVTDASLLVILCADLKAWAKNPDRYWQNAPEEVRSFLVPAIKQYYDGREDVQRDEAHRSCGMAGMTLMLAAKAMGLESCPMDGFDFDKVAQIINLPDDHVISFMVAIGKGTKEPWPKPGQLSAEEVTLRDRF